jgi:hypothetical protein
MLLETVGTVANPAYRQILYPGHQRLLEELRDVEDGLSNQRRVRALITYLAQHPELREEIRQLAIRDEDIEMT